MAKGKKSAKSADGAYKTRNWATIVYPDSAPAEWRQTLTDWCCQAFVSPLHDRDLDPDGNPKKAHWHVLVMWDGPRSRSLMEERFREIGGVGCQACNSARGYARYLIHADNPEKAQYGADDVECFGGADYLEVVTLDSDRRKLISDMMDWCTKNQCTSFRELCDYARQHEDGWFRALTSNSTMIMYRYLRSFEHELEQQLRRQQMFESKQRVVDIGKLANAPREIDPENPPRPDVDSSLRDDVICLGPSTDWDPMADQHASANLKEVFG